MSDNRLMFLSRIDGDPSAETNALLLASSIRKFAGRLSKAPIWFVTSPSGPDISKSCRMRLEALDTVLTPGKIDRGSLDFPLAGLVAAAAFGEAAAATRCEIAAWLDSNTVVLQEPSHFLLAAGKDLAYRPVHHINIGSRFDRPLDDFWKAVYLACGVRDQDVFPMTTHVDGLVVRPYFNAGILVVRPEQGLLRKWADTFFKVHQRPPLVDCYGVDRRYAVFAHQAVLSGVILAHCRRAEMVELPSIYNYPLHLHSQDVTPHRPAGLEELITFRHEGFYAGESWRENLPAGPELKKWLASAVAAP